MAKKKKEPEKPKKDQCPYCDELTDRIFECPKCSREGCPKCMPAGIGCLCPQCEKGET